MLIGIWAATTVVDRQSLDWHTFCPIWSILGWGVGLAFHAFGAYGVGRELEAREEGKLRQKYGRA